MSIGHCRSCLQSVSLNARECPRCGYWGVPNNVTAAMTRWGCGTVLAIVWTWAIMNMAGLGH